jgi:preprotein translocase subunit SecD
MLKSRPAQYFGLLLLILAALAVIFFPIGSAPKETDYTVYFTSAKPWQQFAKGDKTVADLADTALLKAFANEPLPTGRLTIVSADDTENSKSTLASISDKATTQEEANKRVQLMLDAFKSTFPGVTLSDQTENSVDALSPKPLFSLGQYAIFPIKEVNGSPSPAVKLGLDLQGGVNLVLQVRRALFTYSFDKAVPNTTDARYEFTSKIRAQLKKADPSLGLDEANVNISPDQNNILEIRTQAGDKDTFDKQTVAINQIMKNVIPGVTFTQAGDPQFFLPQKDKSGKSDFSANALLANMVTIVRSRVDKLGVSEPLIQQQPPDRIVVQLPGIKDPQRAIDVIGKTAQMEIRLLPEDITPLPDPNDPNNTLFQDKKQNLIPPATVRQESMLVVTGNDLKPTSQATFDQGGKPAVTFELKGDAANKFGQFTARYTHRYMPIFMDNKCISAPTINEPILGGNGIISGGFSSMQEARDMALLLNSGALPAPIDVVENRTVSATLGADSLAQSLKAGLLGLIAVCIFMIVFYRLPGLLADFALAIYCVLNLAVFILIGGTLTLPGIAGFLLALAMSLDTNILIFERLREEMGIQSNFLAAAHAGFDRAWAAIFDSHVTTLIAAIVLFFLGSGPVKGFALTLGVGVILSLFSAISVTRLFLWSLVHLGDTHHELFAGGVKRAPSEDRK